MTDFHVKAYFQIIENNFNHAVVYNDVEEIKKCRNFQDLFDR
jgi:hypothetical protein